MAEIEKYSGKLAGRSKANDGLPHDVVIAVVGGISAGISGGIASALTSKLIKSPSPTKTPPPKTQHKKIKS